MIKLESQMAELVKPKLNRVLAAHLGWITRRKNQEPYDNLFEDKE